MDGIVSAGIAQKALLDIEIRKTCWLDTHKRSPHYTGDIKIIKADTYKDKQRAGKPSNVVVTDRDALSICRGLLLKHKKNILFITQACNTNKGGGVEAGANTIEAELCRRTNMRKVLKRVDAAEYPLKVGTVIYAKGVTVFKDQAYEDWAPFEIDVASITLPNRPSIVNNGNKDQYELDVNREITEKTIKKTMHVASKCGYDTLVFNHVGMSLRHPVDEFIRILKESFATSGIEYIFVIIPSGSDVNPEEESDRLIWIKFCRQLDNVTKDLKKCEEPKPVKIKPSKTKSRKKLSKSRFDDNYDVDDDREQRNYQSYVEMCKRIEERGEPDESDGSDEDSPSESDEDSVSEASSEVGSESDSASESE